LLLAADRIARIGWPMTLAKVAIAPPTRTESDSKSGAVASTRPLISHSAGYEPHLVSVHREMAADREIYGAGEEGAAAINGDSYAGESVARSSGNAARCVARLLEILADRNRDSSRFARN